MTAINVGDSRCILGREDASGRIYPEEVTQDHKPDDPIEQRRIERLGGRVEKMMYVVCCIWWKGVGCVCVCVCVEWGEKWVEGCCS